MNGENRIISNLCTKRDLLKQLIPLWFGDTKILEEALLKTEAKIEKIAND